MQLHQEGNDQVIDDYSILPIANERIDLEYESDENVYVETIDALMIGEAAMLLGAGRATIDDKIDEMAAALVESVISHLSSRDDLEKAAVTVAEGIKDYSTGKRGR